MSQSLLNFVPDKKLVCFLLVTAVCMLLNAETSVAQTWEEGVGYDRLVAEYGTIEDGLGIAVSMAEADALADPALFRYMPNSADPNLSGKNLIDGSGLNNSGTSGHASGMAREFFGGFSITQGETDMTVFEANDYVNRVLGLSTGLDPLVQNFKVQNHSWVGDFPNDAPGMAGAVNTLQRMDFVVNRDQMSVVCGLNNTPTSPQNQLFSHAFNVISVGRVDGIHSRGQSTIYGPGRIIPGVVTDRRFTSAATARTSSVVALLHHKAVNDGNPDGSRPETIKSILMAGATKDLPLGWSRTTAQPLDEIYGAGAINVYNSYKILEAGETDGVTKVPTAATVGLKGWDYGETIDPANPLYYSFEITDPDDFVDISLLLTWNFDVTDNNPGTFFDPVGDPLKDLADMSLRLYDSTVSPLGTLLDASLSGVDNVEHIFLETLGPGLYTIEISSDRVTDFALAWCAVPEPVVPEANKLRDGVLAGGVLADIFVSDDQYLELDPSPTKNPVKQKIDMILLSTSNTIAPAGMSMRLEAAMIGGASDDVIQSVEMFNYVTSEFELVDVRPAATVDVALVFTPTGDPSRFVNAANGEIVSRIIWKSASFAGGSFFWSIDIDEAVWLITD